MCGGGGGGDGRIKDTAAQKKLAQIAARRFNLYQQYYVPLENQFIGEVLSLADTGKFNDVAGVVSSSLKPEFDNARKLVTNRLFQNNVDPSSGRFMATSDAITAETGSSIGRGTAAGQSGQLDRYYQGLQNVVAMGTGQAGQTMSGLGDIARYSGDVARARARGEITEAMAREEAVGTALGSGLGYYTSLSSLS